ncbi:MAG: hypothetical protein V2J51_16515 [Erythrobacter sp.]|jgi:hypothetical protein|nr:hypothetical protein [Erythrobacter sp.]
MKNLGKPIFVTALLALATPALADSSSFVSSSSSSNGGKNSVSVLVQTTGNGQAFGTATAGNETVRASSSGNQTVFVSNSSAARDIRGEAMIQRLRDRVFSFWR